MPDYMFQLMSRLTPEQRAVVLRVQELANEQGTNIYLTGGAVRDLISGAPIRDLDFTVEGNPTRLARELEKGGARLMEADEHLRHYEMIFGGEVDGSISCAREDVYAQPGAKAEARWSTIMEDLRRRDFSVNAVAISLNPNSRGLLLDPTNGLGDMELREIRALSIHSFTNQPVRLMSSLRFAARMGFKLETRTKDWFELAIQRGHARDMNATQVGRELLALGREENPIAVLKGWEWAELLPAIHSKFPRKKPDYDGLARLAKARDAQYESLLRPRLMAPVVHYTLARLSVGEQSGTLRRLSWHTAHIHEVMELENEAKKVIKMLTSAKTNAPAEGYRYLEQVKPGLLAFIQAESGNSAVQSKMRNYLTKWRPTRASLPYGELEALGVPRGPFFDKVMEGYFLQALKGKGKMPEERQKILKKLAGIKDDPKKKGKEEKPAKGKKPAEAGAKTEGAAAGKGGPARTAGEGKKEVAAVPAAAAAKGAKQAPLSKAATAGALKSARAASGTAAAKAAKKKSKKGR